LLDSANYFVSGGIQRNSRPQQLRFAGTPNSSPLPARRVYHVEKPAHFGDVSFDVQLPLWDYNVHEEVSFNAIRETALLSEDLRYDFVSLDDHLMRGHGNVFYEAWTTLSMLAAITTRVRFQNSVLCIMYRPPSLLAKMAATLDVASGASSWVSGPVGRRKRPRPAGSLGPAPKSAWIGSKRPCR